MESIAIIDQHHFLVIEDGAKPPKKSVVFRHPGELLARMSVEQMDAARAIVLRAQVAAARSREEASRMLWASMLLAGPRRRRRRPREQAKRPVPFVHRDWVRIELVYLNWVRGEDQLRDRLLDRMPAQARAMVDMLTEDGRRIWTNDEVVRIVVTNAARLGTTQDPRKIWKYYRGKLFARKILRKVKRGEFDTAPEFANLRGEQTSLR